MSLGERLYELRKSKNLSQEEVAEKLNVTRQTVSKWETDESKPDFDKIIPICSLFDIEASELLTGEEIRKETIIDNTEIKRKKALFISISILLYFIAVIWIIISEDTFSFNEGISVSVFLSVCAIATCIIVYQAIAFHVKREEKIKTEDEKRLDRIINATSGIFCIIYFLVSFITMAWHLTWIIWILFAVVREIIIIIYNMKGNKDEE